MKTHRYLIALIVILITSTIPAEQVPDKDLLRGLNSILPQEAYNLVKTMALPEFAGRHTGHEGYTKAARWAAQIFKQWGLKPISKQ